MREIDTDALRNVSPVLGIGAPVTSTRDVVFDDDNLQQTLDVGRYVTPMIRGNFEVALQSAAGVLARSSVLISSLFDTGGTFAAALELAAAGMDPTNTDVWIGGLQVLTDTGSSAMDGFAAGFLPAGPNVGSRPTYLWVGGSRIGADPLVAGGLDLTNNNDEVDHPPYPILVQFGPTAALLHMNDAAAGQTVNLVFVWSLMFTRKGLPVWYAV